MDALPGVQGRDPRPAPKEAGQQGCQGRSVDLTVGDAGCQVITVRKTGGMNHGKKLAKFIQDCTICVSCC